MATLDDSGILELKYVDGRVAHVRWSPGASPEIDVRGAHSVRVLQLPSSSAGGSASRVRGIVVRIGLLDESGTSLRMEAHALGTAVPADQVRIAQPLAESFANGLEHLAATLRAGDAQLPVQPGG